jgi:hypothetical protein
VKPAKYNPGKSYEHATTQEQVTFIIGGFCRIKKKILWLYITEIKYHVDLPDTLLKLQWNLWNKDTIGLSKKKFLVHRCHHFRV